MCENQKYSLRINPFLSILGNYNNKQIREIDQRLQDVLEANNLSVSRYKRYKTDTTGEHQLLHNEAEVIFKFFQTEFAAAIASTTDQLQLKTLNYWTPQSSLDIYWSKEELPATTG